MHFIAKVLTLYFSKRQIQALSSDTETRVLNDLDEKFHRLTEIVMGDPSIQKVYSDAEARDYPQKYGVSAKEMAFAFYILTIYNHAYTMRQRKIFDDAEWDGWLRWMRNSFHRGTVSNIWKQVESAGWFNPKFQKFINAEMSGT